MLTTNASVATGAVGVGRVLRARTTDAVVIMHADAKGLRSDALCRSIAVVDAARERRADVQIEHHPNE